MALRQADSVPSQIMETKYYLSGEAFTNRMMSKYLQVHRDTVTDAIQTMLERGDLMKTMDGRYFKPLRHEIHTMRLANPVYDERRDHLI